MLLRLDTLIPEPIHWLWPSRLAAGKLSLLDGDPEQGKSLLTLDIAARLTTARPLPDGFTLPDPVSVLLAVSEDALTDTVIPRLRAAGADLGRVQAFRLEPSPDGARRKPVFPDHCGLLAEDIKKTAARLVIIEPFLDFVGQSACSLSDQLIRQALTPLAQVAEERRSAVPVRRFTTTTELRA